MRDSKTTVKAKINAFLYKNICKYSNLIFSFKKHIFIFGTIINVFNFKGILHETLIFFFL